jgi:hypothetical protein
MRRDSSGQPIPDYFIGLDLGQAQDPTALAVIERHGDEKEGVCHVPQLKRYPIGTSYDEIVKDLAAKIERAPEGTQLIVDGTGVGRAVTDMILQHPGFRGTWVRAVTITAGNDETYSGAYWKVPKRNLVGVVQVLLQSKRLKIAAELPDTQVLVSELQNFKVRTSDAGNDVYGEWRASKHDDLVLAVAFACWAASDHRTGRVGVVSWEEAQAFSWR